MGVIDRSEHGARCECGTTERVTLLEYGSGYGTSWQTPPDMEHFSPEWGSDAVGGPVLISARCRACGRLSTVRNSGE